MTGIPQKFKWAFRIKSIKPFDCELCLAFWLTLIHELILKESLYLCIGKAFACAFCANLIYKLISKL